MKEMRFYIDTPPIEISQLSENNDFQMDFDLIKDEFVGVVTINLDPDSIEWDFYDEHVAFPKSFNKLIITLSVTTKTDISSTQLLEIAYFSIIDVLETFFEYIQVELGQYWVDIGFIQDWGLFMFLNKTKAKWIIDNEEIDAGVTVGAKFDKVQLFSKSRKYPEYSTGLDVKQIPDIKSWHKQNGSNLSKHLLADAKRLFFHGDYKSSSILAITVLEQTLEKFIKERCKSKGISNNTLSAFDKSHYIGDYLKLLLPLVLKKNELSEWLTKWAKSKEWYRFEYNGDQVIEWAIKLNQARNDAVHEGETPRFETLDKGIFAVEALYEFAKEGTNDHS